MIAWIIKNTTDDDGEVNQSTVHAYRKKKPVKGSRAMPKTFCQLHINWKAENDNNGFSFTPAFPPGESDKVCETCKKKAT